MTVQWFAESKAKLEWFGLTQGLIGETQRQGVTLVATLIGPRGPVRTLVPRGDWDNATEYSPLDVVTNGDSTYLAILTNTNSEPPSVNWQVLAESIPGPAGVAAVLAYASDDSGTGFSLTFNASLDYIAFCPATDIDDIENPVVGDFTGLWRQYANSVDVAAAAASASAASTSETNTAADRVQTALDVIATAADVVSTNADAVSTAADASATAADLVQTNLDTIATAADRVQTGLDAVATAADVISTAADVVLTNADVVSTNADAISTAADAATTAQDAIDTAADAISTAADASSANASASTATTQAGIATTQASNAATSASNASTAQTNAETAETNADLAKVAAEAAQVAAEAAEANTISIFDQFGDQYLGSKASDPTVDNDGDALNSGDIYWNTTNSTLRFYNGANWVAPETIASSAASAAQTAQTGAELAETNAQTSETNAAASETAAGISETNAAASESNANASAIATAADLVQTNLDQIATSADAIATAADRVQTGLDVVSTGADVISSAASAASALSDKDLAETARIAAEAAAADAGLDWQGPWVTATAYALSDGVYKTAYGSYFCILAHTSGATSEPGIGASWETYWDLIAADASIDATTMASTINSATAKATPIDGDLLGIVDSADSNSLKKLSWANLKATTKTYFDAIYATVAQGTKADTAHAWGDHSLGGYLTSQTSHADVIVDGDFVSDGILKRTSAGVYGIVTDNSTNWNSAYSWGDHSLGGYLTSETSHADVLVDSDASDSLLTDGSNPNTLVKRDASGYIGARYVYGFYMSTNHTITTRNTDNTFYSSTDNFIRKNTKAGMLASLNIEDGADVTDTANVTAAGALMDSEITNLAQVKAFNTADYATAAQGALAATALQSETSHADVVVDGDFGSNGIMKRTGAGAYGIVTDNSSNWDTAFGWGNHASGGYLTSETSHADVLVDGDIGSVVQGWSAVLDATTASFLIADESKLDGIEAGADVTDATNVTAAGALMDSEVTNLSGIKTLTVPDSTTITAAAKTVLDDTTVAAMVNTLGGATSTGTGGLVRTTSSALVTPAMSNPVITGVIQEDIYTITDGAAFAIDPNNGSIQLITLGANRTPTAANFDNGDAITMMINDGTAYTITWTTVAVTWIKGSAPTLHTTAYTVVVLWKVGGVIYGKYVGATAA